MTDHTRFPDGTVNFAIEEPADLFTQNKVRVLIRHGNVALYADLNRGELIEYLCSVLPLVRNPMPPDLARRTLARTLDPDRPHHVEVYIRHDGAQLHLCTVCERLTVGNPPTLPCPGPRETPVEETAPAGCPSVAGGPDQPVQCRLPAAHAGHHRGATQHGEVSWADVGSAP